MAGSITILAVARASRSPLDAWISEMLTRAGRYARMDVERMTPSRERRAHDRRERESSEILQRISGTGSVVALDSRGKSLDSTSFASRLEGWRERGTPKFVVGGPDGLAPSVLERADEVLSFGPMTLPHELALAVLVEQVYRALAAGVGHPYGRH